MKDFNKEGFTWSCVANMQKQEGEDSQHFLYKIKKKKKRKLRSKWAR